MPDTPADKALHDIPTELLERAIRRQADATVQSEGPLGVRLISRWRIAAELRRRGVHVLAGAE